MTINQLRRRAIRTRDNLARQIWPQDTLEAVLNNPICQCCLRNLLVYRLLTFHNWSDADAAHWGDRVTGCLGGDPQFQAQDILPAYPVGG